MPALLWPLRPLIQLSTHHSCALPPAAHPVYAASEGRVVFRPASDRLLFFFVLKQLAATYGKQRRWVEFFMVISGHERTYLPVVE